MVQLKSEEKSKSFENIKVSFLRDVSGRFVVKLFFMTANHFAFILIFVIFFCLETRFDANRSE